MKGTFIIVC